MYFLVFVTYLAALRWTISILFTPVLRWGSHTEQAYSSDGLTNDLYASSLTDVEPMFKLQHRKPRLIGFTTDVVDGFPFGRTHRWQLPDILPRQPIRGHDHGGTCWMSLLFYYMRWWAHYIFLGMSFYNKLDFSDTTIKTRRSTKKH